MYFQFRFLATLLQSLDRFQVLPANLPTLVPLAKLPWYSHLPEKVRDGSDVDG